MNARAADLIRVLHLEAHPEGGYYRQVYRSSSLVQPRDERGVRASLTTIYFLLTAADISRWHLVASDEVWHFYEGAPLDLFTADAGFERIDRHPLGPVSDALEPVHVVAAGRWQAARSTGVYTLVGCTVGPGFEFDDFRMLAEEPDLAARLRRDRPEYADFV